MEIQRGKWRTVEYRLKTALVPLREWIYDSCIFELCQRRADDDTAAIYELKKDARQSVGVIHAEEELSHKRIHIDAFHGLQDVAL
jgi:hypothetical protein